MRRIVRAAMGTAALAAVLSLTACNSVGGTASPSFTGTAPDTSTASSGGAPKVTNPLDASKYDASAEATCGVLTATQVKALGINGSSPKPATDAKGNPGCGWLDPNGNNIGVAFSADKKANLDNLYNLNKQHYFGYFEPTTVDGYPGVYADVTDLRSQGQCTMSLGLADDSMAILTTTLIDSSSNCTDVVNKLASSVIATVKGGA